MPTTKKRRVFPFTAVIGQEEMKLALLLNVIDPRIGGVMIMGDRGTGKSTTIRALADLLPAIDVVKDDPYNSSLVDPDLQSKEVLEKIDDISDKGGMEKLIETGEIEKEIADSSIQFQNNLDSKEEILIGVNKFINNNEENLINVESQKDNNKKRIDLITQFKKDRDHEKVANALSELEEKAKSDENLIPHIVTCAKNKCTLGEISDTLRKVFGEYS